MRYKNIKLWEKYVLLMFDLLFDMLLLFWGYYKLKLDPTFAVSIIILFEVTKNKYFKD